MRLLSTGRAALGCALAAALWLLAPAAHAAIATYDLSFQTTDQSMWDSGQANVFQKTEFLGVGWQNQGVSIDAIAGDEDTNLINPLRITYDAAFATCNLAFSASVCINGQSAQVPVPALGNRPSVRSCGAWAFACQAARALDYAKRAAYDAAFATCRLAYSATVCRNGQPARLPVLALGTAPPQYLNIDTRTGFALEGTSDGRVGLELGVRMDSGSVDATVSFQAALDIPDTAGLDKANPISFNPNSQLAGANSLDTTFPTMVLTLDTVMQLSGSVSAEGCFLTQGCKGGSLPFHINETAPILAFNADGEGGVELFGLPPSAFNLPGVADGFPLELPVAGLADITLHLPQPNASGGVDDDSQTLKASGQDDLLDLSLDVDNIIATAAGLPGLFGRSFDLNLVTGEGEDKSEFKVGEIGFDIIDVSMGPTIDLVQDFELDPTLYVTLLFDEAVRIGGEIVTSFTSAWDLLPDITFLSDRTTVTPTFFLDATLHNRTLLDFDLEFGIDLLQIFYDFPLLGELGTGEIGVGTLLAEAVDLFRSPDLFSKLFALQGFNIAVGDSFVIDFGDEGSSGPATSFARAEANPIVLAGISNAAAIPEPATVVLLGVGLWGLYATRRRVATSRPMRRAAAPPAAA